MTGLQYLLSLHEVCKFQSQEKGVGIATNSEVRRWLESWALRINETTIGPKTQIPKTIYSVVLFPKSAQRRCTIL